MERSALVWLLCTAAVMLGMPGVAAAADSDTYLVLIVLEFFIVGPLWSLLTGIFAGWRAARSRWWLAVANPVLFLCGSWVFIEMGELDFLYYAFSYLMVGLLTTFVTAMLRQRSAQK